MRYWLGVVQLEHVLRGVAAGIAQTNHGAKSGIQRMSPGDGLVCYSPKTAYPDGAELKEFTAIGRVADADPWQADEGDFQPWRRLINYEATAHSAPIGPLREVLEFTRGNRNWGFVLRRGQVELSKHDFAMIVDAMGSRLPTG